MKVDIEFIHNIFYLFYFSTLPVTIPFFCSTPSIA